MINKDAYERLQGLVGKRVRYEHHGEGDSLRYDPKTYSPVKVPYSVAIEGTCGGWVDGWDEPRVEIVGYGMVPARGVTLMEDK